MKHLKSLKSILLAGILFASLTPQNVRAAVDVNATNFPDDNFRAIILEFAGSDKKLSDSEIRNITELYISNEQIGNLKGIEHLTYLRTLDCSDNDLEIVDLRSNTQLTALHLDRNFLEAVGLSKLTNLVSLSLSGNYLTNIDLSKNIWLSTLVLDNNELTFLDLTANTELTRLYVMDNHLRTLDLSHQPKLTLVQCYHNQFNYAAMRRLVNSLYGSANDGVDRCLDAYSTDGTEGNSSINYALAAAKGWRMGTMSSNGAVWTVYEGSGPSPIALNETYFDAKFLAFIKSQNYGHSSTQVTLDDLYDVTTLDVSGRGLTSLKGIEYFTGLEILRCGNNDITELDLSENIFLLRVDIRGNRIFGSAMDRLINSLPKMMLKECYVNSSIFLDSENGAMDCYKVNSEGTIEEGNVLSLAQAQACHSKDWYPSVQIDHMIYNTVPGEAGYEGLREGPLNINPKSFPDANFRSFIKSQSYGSDGFIYPTEINSLTTLEVTDASITSFAGLEYFSQLKDLRLKNQANLTSLDVSRNTNLTNLICTGNKLQALDVSKNNKLLYLYCHENQLQTLTLPNGSTLKYLYCYKNQLQSLNLSQYSQMTEIYCYENQLQTLTLPNGTALKKLRCHINKLKTLNLSRYTQLEQLECHSNVLETLTLPNSNLLKTLDCSYNQLKTLNVSGITNMTALYCHQNKLETLTLPNGTDLKLLYCQINQLKSLDLSRYSNLTTLWCNDNQLENLDMPNSTVLTDVRCQNNQLTSLNLEHNIKLSKLDCSDNQLEDLTVPSTNTLKNLNLYRNQLSDESIDQIFSAFQEAQNTGAKIYVYDNTLDAHEGNAFNCWNPERFIDELSATLYHFRGNYDYTYSNKRYLYFEENNYGQAIDNFAGYQVTVPLKFSNCLNIRGFLCDLVLPDGVTLAKAEVNTEQLTDHRVTYTRNADNPCVYRFNVEANNNFTPFMSVSGTALTLTLNVMKSVEDHVRLQNITMKLNSRDDNNQFTTTAIVTGPVTSKAYAGNDNYIMGDVNNSYDVTPADAIMILYHYFGVEQARFNMENADLNYDGSITPADAIETLYKYFDASGARPTLPASLATEAGEPE